MKMTNYYDKRIIGFFKMLAAIILLAMVTACAGGDYGSLVWDRQLDNTFTNYQILPDHKYYITGGYGAPAAILAINNDYQLVNDANLWVPVPDVSPARMQGWIDSLSRDIGFWNAGEFMAAYIVDKNGKRVGAWYSGDRNPVIKFFEGNRIKVYPPNLKPNVGGDRPEGHTRP
ncbi:MAG: hypothetical protein ACWGN1_01880 [Desulfobulbales bacterium]